MSTLSPPVALITGATSGIGAATAEVLASAGWALVLLGRRRDRLEDVSQSLVASHNAVIETCMVEQSDQVAFSASLERAAKLGTFRLVVLAAGHGRAYGDLLNSDPTLWPAVINDNLLATVQQVRSSVEALIAKEKARIVVVGSVHSTAPAPSQAIYAAAKHGLRGFLDSVRAESSPAGFPGITLLDPGATNTEFADVANGISPPRVHSLDEWTNRPLTPDQVAAAVAWITTVPDGVDVPSLTIIAQNGR